MSYIRFFHGCPEMGSIAVYMGGMPVTRELAYGEATPHFLMGSGQMTVRIEENGKVRLQNHVIVPKDQAYTLMVLCRSGFPELLAIAEDGALADETQSGVRVGGFAESEPLLDLWSRFRDEEEMLFSRIAMGDVSEYAQLEPGEHSWDVRQGASTISMLPGQKIEKGKLYTLYIIGRNDPEEEEKPTVLILLTDFKPIATPDRM